MPRPRQYQNNAEKQAAYRQRHAAQMPPREGYLASLARSLHGQLREAVHDQESVLPPELLGAAADETLRNLIRYIRSRGAQLPQRASDMPTHQEEGAAATSPPVASRNRRKTTRS